MRKNYTKQQVTDVIHGKDISRIPLVFHKWWGMGLEEKYGHALDDMAKKYPEDIMAFFYTPPGEDVSYTQNPHYRWGFMDYSDVLGHSIGERKVLLDDWEDLDRLLADFPDPNEPGTFDGAAKAAKEAGEDVYKLGCWWHFLHERFWNIRGMENLMFDYYDAMDELKLLGKRLLEYYKVIVDRFKALGYDGIFTSDDLGHQTGPMMSPEIFHELYYPLYKEFIDYVHSRGMDFFLHSCGDNSLLMDDLAKAGVDVFHPIQKGCMDMEETVEKYGSQMAFLAGFDVQHVIVEGTTEDVRREVCRMKDIFKKHHGRMLMAAGNGIMPDTPFENIEAMLDEMCR
ncbi:MAG TPA: methylcobamide--CoM methyltransferase [Candidatus Scybalocola faecavium]|nr:methylcobamide--CoM methyltransferase [Candidatus Scybalocola faecavium]